MTEYKNSNLKDMWVSIATQFKETKPSNNMLSYFKQKYKNEITKQLPENTKPSKITQVF